VTLLALRAGLGWRTLWVVPAVALGQFSLGWSNDYLDRDSDAAAGRGDKPLAAGLVRPGLVESAALVGAIGAIGLSLPLGLVPAAAHGGGLALGQLHNFGLKRTALSPLPFALGLPLIPVFLTAAERPPHLPALEVMAAAALVGAGIHFVNAVRDIQGDRRVGVMGLPQRLGDVPAALLGSAAITIAVVILLTLPRGLLDGPPISVAGRICLLAATVVVAGAFNVMQSSGHPWRAYRIGIGLAALAVLAMFARGGL
jgi:4-hydroxybenzoate polyprenyltransferase